MQIEQNGSTWSPDLVLRRLLAIAIVCVGTLIVASLTASANEHADEAAQELEKGLNDDGLDLGGRTAVSGNFSVVTINPEDLSTTSLIHVGSTLTRSSDDARFEYGIGLSVAGMLTDSGDITIVTPSVLARINSDLIGPDDNVLVYLGIVAGVSILEIDVKGGSDTNDESGAFGPKFGAEYYWTSNIAFQIEDTITFDTDEGLTNNLTLGVKYLF